MKARQLGRAVLKFLLPLSAAALTALMGMEGFRAMPYKDIAGIWTDGYGNTHGVKPGVPVTREQAEVRLADHVAAFQRQIDGCLYRGATQGQSDAYTILAYNIGPEAFCNSSIASNHADGRFKAACDSILLYNKARVNGVLRPVQGLTTRRHAERAMCLKG